MSVNTVYFYNRKQTTIYFLSLITYLIRKFNRQNMQGQTPSEIIARNGYAK